MSAWVAGLLGVLGTTASIALLSVALDERGVTPAACFRAVAQCSEDLVVAVEPQR